MRVIARAFFAAVGVASAAPAFAADLAPPSTPAPAPIPEPILPSTWHFEATLDGFAPDTNINSGFRNLPTLPVYANIFQLLRHLEGIVPVSAVAYNDNFIAGVSLFWVRLGRLSGNFTPGDGSLGGVNADLTINESFATAYGGVRIPTAAPDWSVYATIGARYFNVNGTLTLGVPVVGFSRSASQGRSWADPVAGLRGRHRIDDKWSVEFETDAGGYSGSATAQGYGGSGISGTSRLRRAWAIAYSMSIIRAPPSAATAASVSSSSCTGRS